jgi:hypothetical protein
MTPDEILREAVHHTVAAQTATVWVRFAKAGDQPLEAAGYVDFARRRSHLRYEIPGEAEGDEPAECEQVLTPTGTYVRAAAPGAAWHAGPSAGGGAPLGDPFGFLDVLATARPGVQAFETDLVSGVSATRYRMVGDGERIWADGSPELTAPLRERLELTAPEDPVIDVWIDEQHRVRRIEGREETPLSPGAEIVTTVEFGDFGIETGEIPVPAADERLDLDDLLPERGEPSGPV